MGSDHNLKTWVSDKLMSLVGFSQPTVVQYVIGLSKQAVSAADVQTKLEEFGCSSSTETRTFAQELFARVPRKAAGLNVSYYLLSSSFLLFFQSLSVGRLLRLYCQILFLRQSNSNLTFCCTHFCGTSALSETGKGSCSIGEEAEDLYYFGC